MAINIPDFKVSYTPVPKNACTSLKKVFYFLETGHPFVREPKNEKAVHIHSYYKGTKFSPLSPETVDEFWKITVIRDPVKRFLSAYSNRVRFHRELGRKRITEEQVKLGAKPNPTLEEFVERYEIYKKVSKSIRHHTRPQVFFLGQDPSYYNRIYQMSELSVLAKDLSEKVGKDLELPHDQSGGPKLSIAELSPNALDKVRQLYARDYDTFDFE